MNVCLLGILSSLFFAACNPELEPPPCEEETTETCGSVQPPKADGVDAEATCSTFLFSLKGLSAGSEDVVITHRWTGGDEENPCPPEEISHETRLVLPSVTWTAVVGGISSSGTGTSVSLPRPKGACEATCTFMVSGHPSVCEPTSAPYSGTATYKDNVVVFGGGYICTTSDEHPTHIFGATACDDYSASAEGAVVTRIEDGEIRLKGSSAGEGHKLTVKAPCGSGNTEFDVVDVGQLSLYGCGCFGPTDSAFETMEGKGDVTAVQSVIPAKYTGSTKVQMDGDEGIASGWFDCNGDGQMSSDEPSRTQKFNVVRLGDLKVVDKNEVGNAAVDGGTICSPGSSYMVSVVGGRFAAGTPELEIVDVVAKDGCSKPVSPSISSSGTGAWTLNIPDDAIDSTFTLRLTDSRHSCDARMLDLEIRGCGGSGCAGCDEFGKATPSADGVEFGVGRNGSGSGLAPMRIRPDDDLSLTKSVIRSVSDGTVSLIQTNGSACVSFTRKGESEPVSTYDLRSLPGEFLLTENRNGNARRIVRWQKKDATWTMETVDPLSLAVVGRESQSVTSNDVQTVEIRQMGEIVSEKEWKEIPEYGRVVVRETQGMGSSARTTYIAPVLSGPALGKAHSEIRPDGSWVLYGYDSIGRVSSSITPFGDAEPLVGDGYAVTGYVGRVRRVTSDYAPVDVRDNGTLSPHMARTTVTEIGSETAGWTEISRSYRAEFTEGGRRIVIGERAVVPGAAYGTTGNQRTEMAYHWQNDHAGRLARRTTPDGLLTEWSYTYDNGQLITEEKTVPVSQPEGIPLRTVIRRTVANLRGDVLREETWLVADSQGGRTLLAWRNFTRDASGRPVRTESSDGSVTEGGWACCGPEWERNADGIETDWAYDAAGRCILEVRNGVATVTDYDLAGNATNVTRRTLSGEQLVATSATGYDSAGRMTWTVGEDGIRTEYAYARTAGGGEIRTILRGAGTDCTVTNVTHFRRDGSVAQELLNGRTVSTVVEGPLETISWSGEMNSPRWTRMTRDVLGRTVAESRPGFGGTEIVVSNRYDAAGRIVETTEWATTDESAPELLRRTLFGYDALGERNLTVTDVDLDGEVDWDGPDRIVSNDVRYVEASGDWWESRTTFAVDRDSSDAARRVETTLVRRTGLGGVDLDGFALAGEWVVVDARGNETTNRTFRCRETATQQTFAWEPGASRPLLAVVSNGLAVASVSRTGVATAAAYDGFGRLVAQVDGRGNRTAFAYDSFGRISSMTDAAGNVVRYGYDALGHRTAVTDAIGHTITTVYDAEGRVLSVRGATYPVDYTYDNWGEKVSMITYRDETLAVGDVTQWLRGESTGLVTNRVNAGGRSIAYDYSADGKLIRRTNARGIVTHYAYDAAGDLEETAYSDGTPSASFARDRAGRLVSVGTDGVSTNLFAYDIYGAVTNEIQNGKSHSRAYDRFGRLAALDGTAYGYDGGSGRLASVVDGTNRFACAYLPGTEFVSGWSCGEFVHATAYEPKRDLVVAVTNRFGAAVVSSFGYENDAAGRRTAIRRGGSAFGDLAGAADAYGYNARSEVVSARRTLGGNPLPDREETFAYDPIGNRTESSAVGTDTAYAANALNQYARVETEGNAFEPQYDADGNQTLVKTPTGVWAVEWNAENRPVRWTCGNRTLLMAYDHMGRRVRYVEIMGGVTNRIATFLYDGYLCIARTADGITDRFLWNPVETVATRPLAMVADGTAYLYTHDANKNVSELVNARTGEIAAHYDYSAFGKTLIAAGPLGNRNPFRFSSEYADDATGLSYFNWRHYDPVHGRWLSEDPKEDAGGLNLYAYCANTLNSFDFLGLVQRSGTLSKSACGAMMSNHEFKFDYLGEGAKEIAPFKWGTDSQGNPQLAAGKVDVFDLKISTCCKCTPQKRGGPKYRLLFKATVSAKMTLVSETAVWRGIPRSPTGAMQTRSHELLHLKNHQRNFEKLVLRMKGFADGPLLSVSECNEKGKLASSLIKELTADWEAFKINEMFHNGENWLQWKNTHNGRTTVQEGDW